MFKKYLFAFIIYSLISSEIISKENNEGFEKELIKNKEPSITKVNEEFLVSEYLIGPGDTLFLNFRGIELFSKNYKVNPEGNIILPEIDDLKVEGLSKDELKNLLNSRFDKYIFDPDITVEIKEYRPISIFLNGEVNKPGLYNLPYKKEKLITIPRIFDAIKLAGGVNNDADLKKIKVIRKNSSSQGGGHITANIDLLTLILEGSQDQNLRLQDGDHIFIGKSENLIKDQILAINKTNLNPNEIVVYITGNVFKPGPALLIKGATLNQAIASTGGKKIMTGNIEFIRFQNDGDTLKRRFKYNSKARINTFPNPVLMNGDIINVQKTLLGGATTVIKEISSPIFSGYGLYKIFD